MTAWAAHPHPHQEQHPYSHPKCLPCQPARVTGNGIWFAPSSAADPVGCPPPSGFSSSTSALKRASQACMLPNSDLKAPGGNCILLFHRLSKTVEMPAAAPPQHDTFALPSCTMPAALALRPSVVLSRRVTSSRLFVHCLATLLEKLAKFLRVFDGLL